MPDTIRPQAVAQAADVSLSNVDGNDALVFNDATQKWTNQSLNDKASITQSRPEIRYTGTAWPSRASSIPEGYSGPVTWWSGLYMSVAAPADAVAGDDWVERVA